VPPAVVLAIMITSTTLRAADEAPLKFAIAIHGGAGSDPATWSEAGRRAREATLRHALSTGRDILTKGGASLDAVEQVIRLLEDDPYFNAGRGAVLNAAGDAELDASIMDGRDKSCGAVAAVRTVKNPISLARLVMASTPHVLLVGAGADAFARKMKVDQVDQDYFRVSIRQSHDPLIGTVGCVALDSFGDLAAGTSTGGLGDKLPGRVGDSSILGAGTYADNATCGVSCTGKGEQFIRHAVAYDVAAQMAYKSKSLEEAVRTQLADRLQPADGGIIAVDRSGAITMQFSTAGMPRAAADSSGRFEVHLGPE
jgi:beta-aspartyl-peptidase (threonine type)